MPQQSTEPIGSEEQESVKSFLENDDDEAIDLQADENQDDSIGDGGETTEEVADEEAEVTLEDELEEVLTEPAEDKLEASLDPPTRRQILEQFPDLFKKIPYLEKAMYREQKYTELLPTIADAQTAVEKAASLDNFSEALLQGDLAQVFQYAADNDKNAFYKLVDNMMLDLGKIDENAQIHVIANVGKHLIQQMDATEDKTLQAAAHILNQFITGQSKWIPPSKLAKEVETNDEVEQERANLRNERFVTVRDEVVQTLDRRIEATLEKNIDPNKSMTEFTRKAAITEVKRQIQSSIKGDARFQKLMGQAWQKAAKSNYSKESKDFLTKHYTNKAQLLLPTIIKSVRNQALKGYKRPADSELNVTRREPSKRGPVAAGHSAPNSSGKQRASKTPPAGGTKAYLMGSDD